MTLNACPLFNKKKRQKTLSIITRDIVNSNYFNKAINESNLIKKTDFDLFSFSSVPIAKIVA